MWLCCACRGGGWDCSLSHTPAIQPSCLPTHTPPAHLCSRLVFDAHDMLVELECLAADAPTAVPDDVDRHEEEGVGDDAPGGWGRWQQLGGLVGLHASYLRLHAYGGDLLAHLLAPWAAGLLLDPQALRRRRGGHTAATEDEARDATARVAALAHRHAELLPMYARQQ